MTPHRTAAVQPVTVELSRLNWLPETVTLSAPAMMQLS